MAFPYFKATRLRDPADVQSMSRYLSPRVLADAWSPTAAGGTGSRISADLVEETRRTGALWLAGGIRPDTVGEIIERFTPELIDASSGLEDSPGRKDPARLASFFEEIRSHAEV